MFWSWERTKWENSLGRWPFNMSSKLPIVFIFFAAPTDGFYSFLGYLFARSATCLQSQHDNPLSPSTPLPLPLTANRISTINIYHVTTQISHTVECVAMFVCCVLVRWCVCLAKCILAFIDAACWPRISHIRRLRAEQINVRVLRKHFAPTTSHKCIMLREISICVQRLHVVSESKEWWRMSRMMGEWKSDRL